MAKIEWDDEMSTGVERLDQQHRTIIDTLNELTEAIRTRSSGRSIRPILDRLHDYVDDHFGEEEKCMFHHRCPAARDNEAAHQRFVKNLAFFDDRLRREGPSEELAEDIYQHLGLWLVNHILRTDIRLRASVGGDGGD